MKQETEKTTAASCIKSYLGRVRLPVLFFLFASLVFAGIFYLYNLPTEPVLYVFVLCGALGLPCLMGNFFHYRAKCLRLEEMRNSVTHKAPEFSGKETGPERLYQELVETLYQERMHLLSENDRVRTDLLDYYTLWLHQIKTPIFAMHLLLSQEEEPDRAELDMELFQIEQYTEMALSYLRVGSSSNDFVLKEYDVDEMVRRAVRKYARMFIRRRIPLRFEETHQKVVTDEKWFVFVVEQLLSNALKYTKEGSIAIYYSSDENSLIVEDTGIGIAAEDLPRVFEKGYTGYNGRSSCKSTGIGLYLCRRILDRLSHTIRLTSVPGKGTRVAIGLDRPKLDIE